LPALAGISEAYPGRLDVVEGDALKVPVAERLTGPVRICANLPYNVGTELLVRWLEIEPWPPFWQSMTLMFQREVAERIVAVPGSSAYGRLALLAQWRTTPRKVFDVPPSAFVPAPKVTSSIVHLDRLDTPRYPANGKILTRVVAMAFNQRRKMLRSSLKGLGPDVLELLDEAGIDPTDRAERVDLEQFCALARAVEARQRVTRSG
ncbi:MAG: rRNA adenine dimethyltransferase family protein, partial [Pseudomonadota bacterium]